jgi:hypothetical protein
MISSGILQMVLGIMVFPNLWLVGLLFGSIYGYEISKDYQNKPPTTNIISKGVITIGWFMYKMGQLSDDYYGTIVR